MVNSSSATGSSTLSPESDPTGYVCNLFEQAAFSHPEGIVDAEQVGEAVAAVDEQSVLTALLKFRTERIADTIIDDDGHLSHIQFHETDESDLSLSDEEALSFEERLLDAIHAVSPDASSEAEEQIALDELPTVVAVELYLHQQEGGKLPRGASPSAIAELTAQLELYGHESVAVSSSVYSLIRRKLLVAQRDAETYSIVEALELTNPDELSEAAQKAIAKLDPNANTDANNQAKNEAEIVDKNELKKQFIELLKERNAGFYSSPEASVNDQIEAMIKSDLSVTGKKCMEVRKAIREDKSFLTISFPPEKGGKSKVTKYFGYVEFGDDPLSSLQTMLSDLRSSIHQHKRDAIEHKLPFRAEARKYVGMIQELINEPDWTEHPYSVLEASMEGVYEALRIMAIINRNR